MTLVIFNKPCVAFGHLNQYENSASWRPGPLLIGKTQNISEIIVYNLSQQKSVFVDVTLKSSMTYNRIMSIDYLRLFRLQNGIVVFIVWLL